MAGTYDRRPQAYDAFGDPVYGLPPSAPDRSHHIGADRRAYYAAEVVDLLHQIDILRNRLFYLEPLLAERKKEIMEARTTIGVLSGLITQKDVTRSCDCACGALQTLVTSCKLPPTQPQVVTSGLNPPHEDLLDLSGDLASSDAPLQDGSKLAGLASESLAKAGPIDTAERQGRNVCPIDVAAVEEAPALGSDDPSLAPYVTRFTRVSDQQAERVEVHDEVRSAVCLPSSGSVPQLADSRKIASKAINRDVQPAIQSMINGNGSSAENSMEDDSSENASTGPTSLTSSFVSSDFEAEELAVKQGAAHHSKSQASAPGPACHVPALRVERGSPQGIPYAIAKAHPSSCDQGISTLNDLETLFMPKWFPNATGMLSAERYTAMLFYKRLLCASSPLEIKIPEYFKYGIRYCPCSTEPNIYRTVMLDNLPFDLTLSKLLQHVRGGVLVDAKILDTATITGHQSALITFVYGYAAKSFVDRAHQKPLNFEGSETRVVLLPTPTFPMPQSLYLSITHHSHTRCLQISNFPGHIKPSDLERDLRIVPSMTVHGIEAKLMRPNRVLEVRFTSVKYAGLAWGTLCNLRQYKQCTFKHLPDPCARPWDDSSDTPLAGLDKETSIEEQPISKPSVVEAAPPVESRHFFAHTGVAAPSESLQETVEGPSNTEKLRRWSNKPYDSDAIIQRGRGFEVVPPNQKTGEACTTH
ncbi:MAG: hypothetical protein Q9222_003161 [Ikaeria aurantiellina]